MCVQSLIAPHQAQGLFHRHFLQLTYAYDVNGHFSKKVEEKRKTEINEVNIPKGQVFKEALRHPSNHGALINSAQWFLHLWLGISVRE